VTERRRPAAVLVAVVLAAAILIGGVAAALVLRDGVGSGTDAPPSDPAPSGCGPVTAPEELQVEIVATRPHDPRAYTQGFVVLDDRLVESTGRLGESTLRVHDLASDEELDRVELPDDVFGEGVAVTDDGRLVQLTWTSGVAFVWDADSLEPLGELRYDGEGWGLTTLDDGTLLMSDGSDQLTWRDPEDFSVLERRTVRREGGDADLLNELEWDGEWLWANRYQTDELVRIDPECGIVTGVADLSALRADAERQAESTGDEIDVVNGVAHLFGTDRYLLTGKWWPTTYEVRIVDA
jgi:glutamine cyclotransferase